MERLHEIPPVLNADQQPALLCPSKKKNFSWSVIKKYHNIKYIRKNIILIDFCIWKRWFLYTWTDFTEESHLGILEKDITSRLKKHNLI